MKITLSADLAAIVQEWISRGRYPSVDDAVREAIQLLQEHEHRDEQKLKELRREIGVALKEADRGEMMDFNEQVIEDVKREGRLRQKGNGRKSRSA